MIEFKKEDGIVMMKIIGGKFHVIILMGNVTFFKILFKNIMVWSLMSNI